MRHIERLHYTQLKAALMEMCLKASVLTPEQVCACLLEVNKELCEDMKNA